MTDWERDDLLSANDGLKRRMNDVLDAVEHQRRQLDITYQQLATRRLTASDRTESIEVTVNTSGVVLSVDISAAAYRKLGPTRLGAAVTEAAQRAARKATEATQEALAPITATADGLPDLNEIFPGAPSLKELRAKLLPDPDADAPGQRAEAEAEVDPNIPGPLGAHRDDDPPAHSWTQQVR